MDALKMDTVVVRYKQDPKTAWWTATVPEEPAVVSQGKTLAEAHRRVRKAIALVRGESRPLVLQGETDWSDRNDLSNDISRLIKEEGDLRVRRLEIQEALERTTYEAVRLLIIENKFSFRAAGRLLGITHQRVQQIAQKVRGRSKAYAEERWSR